MPDDPLLNFPGAGGARILCHRSQVFDLRLNRLGRNELVLWGGEAYPLGCSIEAAQRVRDGLDLVEFDPDPTAEVR